jgi:flagellar basal body-associated protein FliL
MRKNPNFGRFNQFALAKTIDQLTSVEPKDHIRAEIMDTFSKILAPAKVHNIFFIDYVLQ